MALNELKITENEINENNVKSAADTYDDGDVRSNKNIFDRLPELIARRLNQVIDRVKSLLDNTYTKEDVDRAISERVVEIGSGDMAKGVYDSDNSGIVDNSERLGGEKPEYYAKSADHTTLRAAVSGLKTDVQNITTDIKYIKYVSSLPANPDENTLYLVKK